MTHNVIAAQSDMFEYKVGPRLVSMQRWDPAKMFWHGSDDSVLIGIGCSWTRGWGRTADEQHPEAPGYLEDKEFASHRSYVARVSKHLGFDSFINMAIPGSNNQTQTMNLVDFLERNRHQFRKIFVLWGVTSIHRWELYCSRAESPWSYMYAPNLDRDEMAEWSHYFRHHWEHAYEMNKLANMILTMDAYLGKLGIEHLFFPAFQPCNKINMLLRSLEDSVLFEACNENNDMLSLMCGECGMDLITDFQACPNTSDQRISRLITEGWLSEKNEHPTEQAHEFIAHRLIQYLGKKP